MNFLLFYTLDFLIFHDCLIGKMVATPISLDMSKVGPVKII